MLDKSMLGRYECIDPSVNAKNSGGLSMIEQRESIKPIKAGIGNRKPSLTIYEGDDVAFKKVKEKIKKGYERREGFTTDVGSNAENFIMTILDDEAA